MTDAVDLDIAPLTLEQIDTLTTTGMNTMASVDTIDLSSISITPGLTVGGGGTGVYTTTGTGATWQWNQPAQTHPMVVESGGRVSLKGEKADIDINGKSLSAWMTKIEERLNILTPNAELEAEWDELRALGEQYRALEKHIQEKTKVWEKLKSMPPPQVG